MSACPAATPASGGWLLQVTSLVWGLQEHCQQPSMVDKAWQILASIQVEIYSLKGILHFW